MHYLKLWIGGKVIQPHIDTNYHIYESKSTEEVTAKTIFFSWYDEGEFFNYNQESNDYNKTGKLLSPCTFYLFLIFEVIGEICILLLNKLNIC